MAPNSTAATAGCNRGSSRSGRESRTDRRRHRGLAGWSPAARRGRPAGGVRWFPVRARRPAGAAGPSFRSAGAAGAMWQAWSVLGTNALRPRRSGRSARGCPVFNAAPPCQLDGPTRRPSMLLLCVSPPLARGRRRRGHVGSPAAAERGDRPASASLRALRWRGPAPATARIPYHPATGTPEHPSPVPPRRSVRAQRPIGQQRLRGPVVGIEAAHGVVQARPRSLMRIKMGQAQPDDDWIGVCQATHGSPCGERLKRRGPGVDPLPAEEM